MAIQGLFSGDLKVRGLNGVLVASDGIVTATSFSSGSSGTSGTSGSSGTSATSGTSGTSATSGTSGTTGTSGSAGTSGTTGSSGTSGTSGSSGSSATSGSSGTTGSSGTSGSSGSSGSTGTSGSSGSSGSSGTSATDGTGGTSGTSGTSATSGTSGTSATSGTAGTSGTSATAGTSGTSGVQGDRYATTSTTTFTLGNAGTITVGTQLAYTVAQSIIVVYDANNYQECEVTAYDENTGVLSFAAPTRTAGSGTYSTWSVNLDGASGGDGSHGTSGTSGSAGTSGTTGTSGSSGSSGTTGTSGSSGSSGTSGTSGRNGIDGSSGASIANWYGSFSSDQTQNVTGANVPTLITYNSVEISNGITISGSEIAVQHTGIYEIGYSAQIDKSSGGNDEVKIWARINGVDEPRTTSYVELNGSNAEYLPFVSYIFELTANDYVEFVFASADSTVRIVAKAATTTPYASPAAPSIIIVAKQVGVAVGTTSGTSGTSGVNGSSGMTGSSGSAGSSGTSGTSGLDGSTGSSGSAGSSGTSGSSGTTGTSGSSGTSGTSGTSGSSGSSGSSGTTGTSGTSATSGTTGTSGSSGTSGNATTSARAVQTYTSTAGQTTFAVTNGYNLGMVDVFVNGVKFVNGVDYTATDGTTVVMAAALTAGQIVELDNYLTAFLPTNALRTITTFTATAAQTTFSVSYTQGLVDVYYNGSCLAQSEYTAINGTSIILATACQVNDIVVVYAYSYSVGAYSGIGGSGTTNYVPKFTSSSAIGNSAITDDGTTVTLVSRALSGTSATFSGFVGIGASASYNLDVVSASDASLFQVKSTATANNTALRIGIDANTSFINATGSSTGILELRTYGTPKLTIQATGAATFSSDVSLANSSSLKLLGGSLRILNSANTATYGYLISSSAWKGSGNNNPSIAAGSGLGINFFTNDSTSEVMTITSGGNVLINTSTDNGSKLNVNGQVFATNFIANSTSAIATLTLSGNSNSNGTSGLRRVVRYIPTVSSGTRTTIPIVSQSSAWCQSFIKVYGYSAAVNWNGNPYYFEAKMAMTHLTSFVGFASWGVVGNINSITTSATEIYINHSASYTQTSSNGIYIVIEYSSNNFSASINIGGIVLN